MTSCVSGPACCHLPGKEKWQEAIASSAGDSVNDTFHTRSELQTAQKDRNTTLVKSAPRETARGQGGVWLRQQPTALSGVSTNLLPALPIWQTLQFLTWSPALFPRWSWLTVHRKEEDETFPSFLPLFLVSFFSASAGMFLLCDHVLTHLSFEGPSSTVLLPLPCLLVTACALVPLFPALLRQFHSPCLPRQWWRSWKSSHSFLNYCSLFCPLLPPFHPPPFCENHAPCVPVSISLPKPRALSSFFILWVPSICRS